MDLAVVAEATVAVLVAVAVTLVVAASMVAVLVAVDISEEAAVSVAVVASAELRTSPAGPRASEAELACHRSDRTLRHPAG